MPIVSLQGTGVKISFSEKETALIKAATPKGENPEDYVIDTIKRAIARAGRSD